MARGDPLELAALRLEARRFLSRCDLQESSIRRADSLREVSRLAQIALPYRLAEDYSSRHAQRRVGEAAEDRAKEIVQEQLDRYVRAEADQAAKLKARMLDDWNNLTGTLGPLRTWAHHKLTAAEQAR